LVTGRKDARRSLLERRYPYLSGGARGSLGTGSSRVPVVLVGAGANPAPTFLISPPAGTLLAVARLLILGGGCRGLRLAREAARGGHVTRIVTRAETRRAEIEAVGAECWIGDPDRLGTLRGALEGATIACWLFGSAAGTEEAVGALHGHRLRSFIGQAIDTTVRGLLYEATGSVPAALLAEGERVAVEVSNRNAIPLAVLRVGPADPGWLGEARDAVEDLLGTD
jgi:hypothetical protein